MPLTSGLETTRRPEVFEHPAPHPDIGPLFAVNDTDYTAPFPTYTSEGAALRTVIIRERPKALRLAKPSVDTYPHLNETREEFVPFIAGVHSRYEMVDGKPMAKLHWRNNIANGA
jgi:hypothetical protein